MLLADGVVYLCAFCLWSFCFVAAFCLLAGVSFVWLAGQCVLFTGALVVCDMVCRTCHCLPSRKASSPHALVCLLGVACCSSFLGDTAVSLFVCLRSGMFHATLRVQIENQTFSPTEVSQLLLAVTLAYLQLTFTCVLACTHTRARAHTHV